MPLDWGSRAWFRCSCALQQLWHSPSCAHLLAARSELELHKRNRLAPLMLGMIRMSFRIRCSDGSRGSCCCWYLALQCWQALARLVEVRPRPTQVVRQTATRSVVMPNSTRSAIDVTEIALPQLYGPQRLRLWHVHM